MSIAYYLTIAFHIIACFFLIGVVLLQQGKSQDLASAFGGGGSQTAFGPRGSANVLTKATAILAGVFMLTSMALSILRPRSSLLERMQEPAAAVSPSPAASAAPAEGSATPDPGTAGPGAPPATPPGQ